MTQSAPATGIPVLDLQAFRSGQQADAFVDEMGQALETFGFFALVNHGVTAASVAAAYQAAIAFFALPDPVKQRYEQPDLHGQRGFTRFGREHAKDHPAPDLKEFWHVGRPGSTNPAPSEVPQFLPAMLALYAQLDRCATDLLCACARYLGQPESWLADMTIASDTILRIIHYPPLPPDAHPASLRAAPHEDINLITLLCAATADGLELQQRDGSWLPIPTVPGQIIVDSGDMLQQVTNGHLRSTTHRVVNPGNARDRRLAMPFFVHPRPEVDLTPLDCGVAGPRLPAITAGEYLQQRLREIGLAPAG